MVETPNDRRNSIASLLIQVYPDAILSDGAAWTFDEQTPSQLVGTIDPDKTHFGGSHVLDEAETAPWGLILARVHSISHAVAHTCLRNVAALHAARDLIADWIEESSIVRILGAGRALLAAAMPGNRLAHAGVQVSFMGGMVPLPNSEKAGGVISCSASGATGPVLEAMSLARKHNPEISILGLADHGATEFAGLCDVFVGVHVPKSEYANPLSALADTEEYVISEILDALVVCAGRKVGFDDDAWRRGHEDIGPTGPYAPVKMR